MYGPATDGPYISPFRLVLNRFHKSRTNFAASLPKELKARLNKLLHANRPAEELPSANPYQGGTDELFRLRDSTGDTPEGF